MEKIIVEEIGFIKEDEYQKIKEKMNKKDDYFCKHELMKIQILTKTKVIIK